MEGELAASNPLPHGFGSSDVRQSIKQIYWDQKPDTSVPIPAVN